MRRFCQVFSFLAFSFASSRFETPGMPTSGACQPAELKVLFRQVLFNEKI